MKGEPLLSVCRCCLSSETCLLRSSSSLAPFSSQQLRMFTECTTITVSKDDGLSLSICSQCAKNIEFCYEFINTCKTTDAALKSYREEKLTDSIKEEDDVPIKEELLELTYHDDNSSQHYDDNNTRDNEEDIKLKVEFDDIEDDETLDKLAAKKFKKASGKADKFVKKNLKQLRKEYKCPVCEIMIIGKRKFNFHLTERHEEYKKYVCPHCKKGFAKSDYLSQHIIIHTNLRPFACDECPKTYKQRSQLYMHKKLHTEEKPFSCEKCGISFKLKGVLEQHNLLHQDRENNLCHLCGASFSQVGNLVVHMRVHTGEKPYACSQCSFRCSVQSGMKRHERIHSNLKSYICHVCQKGFNNSSSLARHLRIHTGELPYKCDHCSKAFVDSWKRKTHMVRAHNLTLDNIPKMVPGRKRVYEKKLDDAHETKPIMMT